MKHTLLLALLACSAFATANAQAPTFNTVTPNATTIERLEKFELTIGVTAGYTNPYDYNDIDVQCIFTSPTNKKDTVDGFYMQNYTLNTTDGNITAGSTHFAVRYAPKEVGTYSYVLMCTNKEGSASQPSQTFTSIASAAHGFIRKNSTNYLGFDDSSQYIPVGENMCWQNSNVYLNYTNWLPKLVNNGGNFIRIWMSSWAFAYEWKDVFNQGLYHGLESYNQYNAYNLDWLLDYCDQQNVYLMLCLNNHGQVSSTVNPEWANNPYNAVNGGPCANTWDFFTNATARDYYKNRIRYLVARCGYSKNIMSWELFNEVNFTDDFTSHQADVTSWHNEMSTYLKALDVNKHLVTTSYSQAGYDANTWKLPNIDFTQIHTYNSVPNLESLLVGSDVNYLSSYHKPVLNGEFGLGPDGTVLSTDDPTGVHIHNAIWATALGGALGTAMTWWWDNYIEPQNLYFHYKPISSFIQSLPLKDSNYKPASATTSGGGTSDLTVSPGTNFAKAPASDFTIDASGKLTPDQSQLSQYIFGSTYNTDYRNPPTFTVTYPEAGTFTVNVGGISTSSPKVTITVDGKQVMNADAVANTSFTVNITSGAHTITVDNLGIDWFNVSSYVFTNIGSPLSAYAIASADTSKAAGWILNTQYNWQYLKNNNTAPAAITGAMLSLPHMQNGAYNVQFFNCETGAAASMVSASVTNDTLSVALPSVAWDVAYTVTPSSLLPVGIASFDGYTSNKKNVLTMNITEATNTTSVTLERSSDGVHFSTLSVVSKTWNKTEGLHTYTDASPLPGNNYYRLLVQDAGGRATTSNIVLLQLNTGKHFSVYPNPVKNEINIMIDAGSYSAVVTDALGKIMLAKAFVSNSYSEVTTLPAAQYAPGIYYLTIIGNNGKSIAKQKIIKK